MYAWLRTRSLRGVVGRRSFARCARGALSRRRKPVPPTAGLPPSSQRRGGGSNDSSMQLARWRYSAKCESTFSRWLHCYLRMCTAHGYHRASSSKGSKSVAAGTFGTPCFYQLLPALLPAVKIAQGGSTGIIVLATVASLGSTAAFTLLNHSRLLRRAAAEGGALDDQDDLHALPRTYADRVPLMGPKEV